MVGPRSALFTPFSRLGLIIIDEEHEAAYKSETVPRYHARETAIARGMLCGAQYAEAFYVHYPIRERIKERINNACNK